MFQTAKDILTDDFIAPEVGNGVLDCVEDEEDDEDFWEHWEVE